MECWPYYQGENDGSLDDDANDDDNDQLQCGPQNANYLPSSATLLKQANQTSQVIANGAQTERVTQSRLRMADIKRTMNGKNLTCVGVHPTINQSTSAELDVQCK